MKNKAVFYPETAKGNRVVSIRCETIMNFRQSSLHCLGFLTTLALVSLPVLAQSATPTPPTTDLKQNKSSSLGGPITPSQPDLFAGSNSLLLQPITLEQESSTSFFNFKSAQPSSSSKRPAAPFVDDLPRPSGVGIINVKTD